MGRKPETARADHEAGDPPDHFTDDLRADLLLEQKRSLEQLNTWFEIALNNMVRGLSMFDREQRLIVCNSSYRQIYSLPEELTRPGTPLEVEEDLLRVVPAEFALHAHHWLILHGRYVCKARRPECPSCIIRDLCLFEAKTSCSN
jgi:PAS domain-containing protein